MAQRTFQLKMKVYYLLIILLILTACTTEQKNEQKEFENTTEKINEVIIEDLSLEKNKSNEEKIAEKCIQLKNGKQINYSLSEDKRILQIKETKFYYNKNKTLESVKGEKDIKIKYEKGSIENFEKLSNSQNSLKELRIKQTENKSYSKFFIKKIGNITLLRDKENRIIKIESPNQKIRIVYDSKSLPREIYLFKTKTSLDYDKKNNLNYITKGKHTTEISYNEKNLPDDFDAGNQNHLIIAYQGRKIAMLSGTLFGMGLAIDYSRDGLNARILNPDDDSEFTAETNKALNKITDLYIYCTKIKTMPDIFDITAYAFFRSYFSKNLEDYLLMNLYCEVL